MAPSNLLPMPLLTDNPRGHARHRVVYDALARRVRQLEPETKLPSVRQLMEEYGVSQATMDRALTVLREEGLVRSEAGKGVFVTRPGAEGAVFPEQVDVLLFMSVTEPAAGSFHRHLLDQFSRLLGERHAGMRLQVLPPDATMAQVEAMFERSRPAAQVVLNLFNPDVSRLLRERGIPHVLLFPNWPADLPWSIQVDNAGVVAHWVDHLTSLGHQRIAHIHGSGREVYLRDLEERRHLLLAELGRRGLPVDPALHVYSGFSLEEGYVAMRDLLQRRRDFTAVVINDSIAGGVYQAITEAGLKVGHEISVIGTDDLEWAAHLAPPLTTTRIERERLARMTLAALDRAIAGETLPEAERQVQAELVGRDSTGSALV